VSADDDPDVHLRQAGAHVDREEEPDGEVLGAWPGCASDPSLGFWACGIGVYKSSGLLWAISRRERGVWMGGVGGWGLGI